MGKENDDMKTIWKWERFLKKNEKGKRNMMTGKRFKIWFEGLKYEAMKNNKKPLTK